MQIHCYRPPLRERTWEVMKLAGPRMLWRHPALAICHVLDGRNSTFAEPPRKTGA